MHYCNILLNAQVVEPPMQTGDTSTQVPASQDIQLVKALFEPELTETMMSVTLGLGTRFQVPKMTPSREI